MSCETHSGRDSGLRPSPAPYSLIARGLSAAKGMANTVRSTADIPVALCGMVGSQRSRYLAYRATSNAIVHRKSAFVFSCGCFAETGTAGTGELGR
jgi:hypothetical protein